MIDSNNALIDEFIKRDMFEIANVYVGVMNFSHREEQEENYIAISEISVSKKPSNLFFDFHRLSKRKHL